MEKTWESSNPVKEIHVMKTSIYDQASQLPSDLQTTHPHRETTYVFKKKTIFIMMTTFNR